MKNKRNGLIFLFVFIGLIMISLGLFQILKLQSYSKTTGKFSYSELIEGQDSEVDSYIWYYKFMVNDYIYTAETKTKFISQPSSNKDIIVYYDSANPEKNIISNDYTRYYLIIIGLMFTSVLLFYSKKEVEDSEEMRARSNAKKTGWFVLFFIGCFLFIALSSYDFSFSAMLSAMSIVIIIFIFFMICGVKILINAYNPKHSFKYEYKDGKKTITVKNYVENNMANDELANRINPILNSGLDKISIIEGIIKIVLGSFLCLIYFSPAVMALLERFDIINTHYKINGNVVTGIQFFKYTTLGYGLLLLIPGIILIVLGIKEIKENKNI